MIHKIIAFITVESKFRYQKQCTRSKLITYIIDIGVPISPFTQNITGKTDLSHFYSSTKYLNA